MALRLLTSFGGAYAIATRTQPTRSFRVSSHPAATRVSTPVAATPGERQPRALASHRESGCEQAPRRVRRLRKAGPPARRSRPRAADGRGMRTFGEEQVCRYGRLETRIRERARTRRRPASFGLLVMHKEKGRVAGPRGSHLPLRSRAMAVADSTRGSARSPRVRRCRCVRLGRLPGCGCRGGVWRGCWRCGCGRCWC